MAPILIVLMSSGSKKEPRYTVCAKPKLHIHKECGFHPLLHTSYTVDYLTALLGEDVSSGYYVQ